MAWCRRRNSMKICMMIRGRTGYWVRGSNYTVPCQPGNKYCYPGQSPVTCLLTRNLRIGFLLFTNSSQGRGPPDNPCVKESDSTSLYCVEPYQRLSLTLSRPLKYIESQPKMFVCSCSLKHSPSYIWLSRRNVSVIERNGRVIELCLGRPE